MSSPYAIGYTAQANTQSYEMNTSAPAGNNAKTPPPETPRDVLLLPVSKLRDQVLKDKVPAQKQEMAPLKPLAGNVQLNAPSDNKSNLDPRSPKIFEDFKKKQLDSTVPQGRPRPRPRKFKFNDQEITNATGKLYVRGQPQQKSHSSQTPWKQSSRTFF